MFRFGLTNSGDGARQLPLPPAPSSKYGSGLFSLLSTYFRVFLTKISIREYRLFDNQRNIFYWLVRNIIRLTRKVASDFHSQCPPSLFLSLSLSLSLSISRSISFSCLSVPRSISFFPLRPSLYFSLFLSCPSLHFSLFPLRPSFHCSFLLLRPSLHFYLPSLLLLPLSLISQIFLCFSFNC